MRASKATLSQKDCDKLLELTSKLHLTNGIFRYHKGGNFSSESVEKTFSLPTASGKSAKPLLTFHWSWSLGHSGLGDESYSLRVDDAHEPMLEHFGRPTLDHAIKVRRNSCP